MADTRPITITDLHNVTRDVINELVPTMIRTAIADAVPTMVRTIIQDTVPDMVRTISKQTAKDTLQEVLPAILPDLIRQGTNDLRSELGNQGMRLKAVQLDVRQLKESVRHLPKIEQSTRELKASVRRLEGLNEEFDDRMKADGELLRDNLNVKAQVDDHETRISGVESLQTILQSAVRDHSRKLKSAKL